jgi:hypothetical protein
MFAQWLDVQKHSAEPYHDLQFGVRHQSGNSGSDPLVSG